MLKKLIFLTILTSLISTFSLENFAYAAGQPKKTKYHRGNNAYADPLPENVSIEDGINQIINRFQGNDNVGIVIKSLDSGRIIYQRNPTEKFTPASTLKLFTAAASLAHLGPNFTFTTEFLTDAPIAPEHGILAGNLYIKFSGDPNLTTDILKKMIFTLEGQGIKTIQGNIIIDDSAIDRITWQTGRLPTDKMFCYAAPVTATVINRNCFSFNVAPSRQANTLASVKVNQLGSVLIENQVVMRRGKRQNCGLDLKPLTDNDNRYLLKGCLSPRNRSMSIAVALQNPNLATSGILANLFKANGISYQQIQYNQTPANARILVQSSSPTLEILLTRMLKKSDNIIADSLFKKLGGVYYSTQGSWHTGRQAMEAILGPQTGINFGQLVILDGSGLSRDNAVSAEDFVKLLTFAYKQMPNNELFYEALPRSGLDGTLKHRLGGSAHNRVHAKTGTMHGISSLAGYIQTVNNKQLAFAILVNENTARNKQWSYHLLEDRICQFLAQRAVSS